MAKATARTGYRIAGWEERYEASEREKKGNGPLGFVKSLVFGAKHGPNWRRLGRMDGIDRLAVLGLFTKLKELVASQPRRLRSGGVILDGADRPADVAAIAELLDEAPETIERLIRAMVTVGWVEIGDVRRRRATSGDAGRRGGAPNETRRNETKTKRNRDITRQDFNENEKAATSGDAGLTGVTARRIAGLLVTGSDGQARADCTTLARLCRHVIGSREPADRPGAVRELTELAESMRTSSLDNPIAGFVAEAQRRWGTWRPQA